MKTLLVATLVLFSTSSFANPFDAFVGKYKTISQTKITAKNAKWCNRYNLKDNIGVEIKADTKGYKQSHVIYLLNPHGWSGVPVMDYQDRSAFDAAIIFYAKTSGSSDLALNEMSTNLPERDLAKISIGKSGTQFILNYSDELIQNGTVVAGCYYVVPLVKHN